MSSADRASAKPWRAIVEGDEGTVASLPVRDARNSLAAVWTRRGTNRPTPESLAEGRANALLMAAAPDLRDALRKLVTAFQDLDLDDEQVAALVEARRALAKARTGEPMEGWSTGDEEADA